MGPLSPMTDVEPALIPLILKMSEIRRCLTPSQCLHLANDLVAGTKTEIHVIEFKQKLYKKDYDSADLGLITGTALKDDGDMLSLAKGVKNSL